MVLLSESEKRAMCTELAGHLPRIRALLRMTQVQLGERCGMSSDRISAIENGRFTMKWCQYTAIMLLCMFNRSTKEYVIANRLLKPSFVQYMQQKEQGDPPDVTVSISPSVMATYEEAARSSALSGSYSRRYMD